MKVGWEERRRGRGEKIRRRERGEVEGEENEEEGKEMQ